MRSVVFFLVFSLFVRFTSGQDSSLATDHEQEQLALCFKYSNELGFNIESISNPYLYDYVNEWLGTPYRYSGGSKTGIDCSGLVCELYKSAYQKILTGSARDIYEKSEPIKKENLREGDLVFFKIRKSRISHVGIYLGSNKFAHASTSRGVIISDLEEPYYKKYYYKGGRLKDLNEK
jgi:lipoprotein Spr